jgi:hypothetical protein
LQAISFIAALLGKQGTAQDALPRSFAAFRRQHQRQQRRQLCAQDSGGDSDDGGGSGDEEGCEAVEDANSSIRWPVLVVCPTSVLDNWMRELNMWGTFKVRAETTECVVGAGKGSASSACVRPTFQGACEGGVAVKGSTGSGTVQALMSRTTYERMRVRLHTCSIDVLGGPVYR